MSSLGYLVLSPSFPHQAVATPNLAIAAARAGHIGVLDAESIVDANAITNAFDKLAASAKNGTIGLRAQVSQVESIAQLGPKADGAAVLVLTAATAGFDKQSLERAIAAAKKANFKVFVEVVSPKEAALAEAAGADALIAKGHESSGRVGDTTSFVLIQQLVPQTKLPVWVQGGVGLHSTAAFATAGAAGVVLDSQLYLCRESQMPPDLKLRIERMDGSETATQQTADGQLYRTITVEGEQQIAVGQDVCFARAIAEIGGTVAGAIDAIQTNVTEQLSLAASKPALGPEAPLAKAHGTRFPIVQGAMTRVSDTSDFAFKVAEGGALPFLALSLMRGADIEQLIVETKEKLGDMPWGVGLLGFVPHQLRQEQMEVVNRHKPPFALIAGGRPDQAKSMEDAGTKTYLHVPSPLLLQSFIEMGSRRFIFEGKECGGHVGPRSSTVLWESMIDVLLKSLGPKDDASTFHILFAGGIHDAMSAAMVATFAARLSAVGMKVGVLVGTAYLFTEEAVQTGAIVKKFQDEALKCDETVLLETGPGHSIRCIASPYKQTFDQKREELKRQNKNRDDIREELELMNLGRLRIASKGLTKVGSSAPGSTSSSELVEIPAEQQWQEGMYMIGQVAAMHDKLLTIENLHRSISDEGAKLVQQVSLNAVLNTVREEQGSEPIAIVGMSCQFPRANDVEGYWQNILKRVDTIGEIPETHFDWRNYYDADPLAKDKIVSKWGGFLEDIVFDPSKYGIPPSSLDSIDPMQVLILEAACAALEDAGYNERRFPREKTSVLLANAGHGPITALYSLRSMLGWKLAGLDQTTLDAIADDLPGWTEDSFAGYLGNVTAGRVANRLDLKGINFSIDAACASSLAALYVGINDLRSGASDVVLLGATDTHNQPGDYLSFSKTHALSKDGRCKTFDASADGIVISEGIAMLVLKRLSDAERDGDRIYAVIRGIGGSSDGRDLSLTAPRPAGQELALKRAYADAGVSPDTVGLIEAHGTGTVAGDKAEVEALTKVFSEAGAAPGSCAIGSVKTNIGHTKAAAGLASIVKVAKALHHKLLPPTINVKQPNPACKFGEGPFYLNTEYRPWLTTESSHPRRAGVSAFGFGGTNFHAVLEEYIPPTVVEAEPPVVAWDAELFVWRGSSVEAMTKAIGQTEAALAQLKNSIKPESNATVTEQRKLFELASKLQLKARADEQNATCITAVVATSLSDLEQKIAQAKAILNGSANGSAKTPGVHVNTNVSRRATAFLFPGQGSQRVNMLRELSLYFPTISEKIAEFDSSLTAFIYPTPALTDEERVAQQARLTDTRTAQPALGACAVAMLSLLKEFGAAPDMVAGHSYGEYVALHAAGSLNLTDLVTLSKARGEILRSCADKNPGGMAAVSADRKTTEQVLAKVPSLYLANLNTPTQCIISGASSSIDKAIELFKQENITCTRIPVSAAFHSPLMNGAQEALGKILASTKVSEPRISVWSNTTASPHEPAAIEQTLAEHALKPVLFADQIEKMHEAGARLFVEVGPGSVLTGLVDATLRGKDFVSVSTDNASARSALVHFLNALAVMTVNGVTLDLRKLFWNRRASMQWKEGAQPHKKNQLLYRVNSVRMERIGAPKPVAQRLNMNPQSPIKSQQTTQRGEVAARGALQSSAPPVAPALTQVTRQPIGKRVERADSSVERVMLEFQQSMLQMTNRFLETQQNVMLAYLQSNGKMPADFAPPSVSMPALPYVGATSGNGNGNGNGHSYGHGNGNGNGNGHAEFVVAAKPVEVEAPVAQVEEQPEEGGVTAAALVESLYEIVSDRTGYPREMLDPTLDLEADLGIDSIKRVEILNNFRKLLPETVQEELESGIEKLAATKTLQGVIEWIEGLNLAGSGASVTTASGAGAPALRNNAAAVGAGAPALRNNAAAVGAGAPALQNSASPLTGDAGKIARGIVQVVEHPYKGGGIAKIGAETIIFKGNDVLELFKLAKATSDKVKNVIVVTQLGGDFGTVGGAAHLSLDELTKQAALVGFTKTLAKEWKPAGVRVRVVDFAADVSDEQINAIVGKEIASFDDGDDAVEVGHFDGKRITLDVLEETYSELPALTVKPITKDSVILVTGGARGITAEIALELARKHQPTFILLGRLPKPVEHESKTTAGLTSAKELKAAIMEDLRASGKSVAIRDVERAYQHLLREREVRETLSAIQAAGSTVRYYSIDVSDEQQFGSFIQSIYETSRIDGVIHGAGVIEDALIKDKAEESFRRVFDTKVKGALTLARNLKFSELKFLYLFSSVVGRTGNEGQCDYVSANEALNKLAVRLRKETGTRVASLMWGPWQAGMAPPELEAVFASHGWSMIQPHDGRVCFYEEATHGSTSAEILLVGKLAEKPTTPTGPIMHEAVSSAVEPATYEVTVDTDQHVFLHDHKFDGIPVMPMAVALEMMLETAKAVQPKKQIRRVTNLDIPAGIVFHSARKDFQVIAETDPSRANTLRLRLNSLGNAGKTHFRCTMELADAPNPVPQTLVTALGAQVPTRLDESELPPSPERLPKPSEIYGTWLFHGPIFQGLQQVLSMQPNGITGRIAGCSPASFSKASNGNDFVLDPVLFDSAMQLAGVWARHYQDVTVLPAGFSAMTFFEPLGNGPAVSRIFLNEALTTELLCDMAIYTEDGRLAVLIEGLAGIGSKAFNRFSTSSQTPVRELV